MKVKVKKISASTRALKYQPSDFYLHDAEAGDLCYDMDAISDALGVAKWLVDNGPSKQGLLLVRKINLGLKQYDSLIAQYKVI